jgi:hypothetical protein
MSILRSSIIRLTLIGFQFIDYFILTNIYRSSCKIHPGVQMFFIEARVDKPSLKTGGAFRKTKTGKQKERYRRYNGQNNPYCPDAKCNDSQNYEQNTGQMFHVLPAPFKTQKQARNLELL